MDTFKKILKLNPSLWALLYLVVEMLIFEQYFYETSIGNTFAQIYDNAWIKLIDIPLVLIAMSLTAFGLRRSIKLPKKNEYRQLIIGLNSCLLIFLSLVFLGIFISLFLQYIQPFL